MIYCVEDDDNIRELVIYTLETTGLKAKGFADGAAFMEALAFDTPDRGSDFRYRRDHYFCKI